MLCVSKRRRREKETKNKAFALKFAPKLFHKLQFQSKYKQNFAATWIIYGNPIFHADNRKKASLCEVKKSQKQSKAKKNKSFYLTTSSDNKKRIKKKEGELKVPECMFS